MIVSDDIEVIQGSLGSGKSMVGLIEAIYQLRAGGVVATNFTFTEDWAYDLAGQDLRVFLGLRDRDQLAQSYYSRCFKIGNPDSMRELSGKRGANLSKMCVGPLRNAREGKGLLILDDCHHFFNSRTFQANTDYVTFFANARKYGWRTKLITHSIENIDKQIRTYVEIESRFRNLKKVRVPLLGLPLSPLPAFAIVRRYAGLGPGSGSIHSRDLYFFDKRAARLYDTLERFGETDTLLRYEHQGKDPSRRTPDDLPSFPVYRPFSLHGQAESWPQYYQKGSI